MPYVSPKRYLPEWQLPFIGQFAHPHPQEDFPFFLSRIITVIIAATTATRAAQIMIVAIFSEIHVSIKTTPVFYILFATFTVLVSLVASLYGLNII